MQVTAEGVETEDEQAMLEGLGCPSAQGHLYARPLTVDDLIERLQAESAPDVLGRSVIV